MKFLKIFERKSAAAFDYQQWIEAAEIELASKQAALEDEFNLGQWVAWNADLATGQLTFSDETGVRVIAEVQIAGSLGQTNWLWAWANSHLPEAFVEDSFEARAFGDDQKIAELAEPSVASDDLEALGWRLTAAAVRLAEGLGAYKAPTKTGAVFLIIQSIRLVPVI